MIKAIIGLGNPGPSYYKTRHSIGFRVIDALADQENAAWSGKETMELATIQLNNRSILLVKPMTYMNSSGVVIPFLNKKGIKADEIMVIHDELELPFGTIAFKTGGSSKGHNGLKSIISACGEDFHRVRVGISRPATREEVPDFVLSPFPPSQESDIHHVITDAITTIKQHLG